MDKGEMRLEPNISLRTSIALPTYKVEVKNINSFSFVEKAITYEIKRQQEILNQERIPVQETRGWDEDKKMTIAQRAKGEAADYRYFPEPDIPPFYWEPAYIEALRKQLPELPDAKMKRFIENYQLSPYNAEILTRGREVSDFFEEAVKKNYELRITNYDYTNEKTIANWIINKKIDIEKTLPAEMLRDIIKEKKVETIDETALDNVLQEVIANNQKAVADYKNGKTTVIMFLIGQAMAKLKGKAKADTVKEKLLALL